MNHYIGMVLILICSVLLSLTKVIYPEGNELIDITKRQLPVVVPVVFGILTPVFFTAQGITQKHLT